jgi:hypothetical protein
MNAVRTPAIAALRVLAASLILAGLVSCATKPPEPELPPRKEMIYAVTASNQLIQFNAGQPRKILSKKAVTGLQPNEEIAAIDFRVAKGVLYALGKLGTAGRLYTIDTASGKATQVGTGILAVPLDAMEYGLDFNPTVDRMRLAGSNGFNGRLHPDTGAVVDSNPNEPGLQTDGRLAFAKDDPNAGKEPAVMAAAYTYNKTNDKITTNYAIDGKLDMLLTQGTKEGIAPAVSPNTGQLFTVGRLSVGESARVSFDIADVSGAAFGAFTKAGDKESKFYLINLESGTASFHGTIAVGEVVKGISVEP